MKGPERGGANLMALYYSYIMHSPLWCIPPPTHHSHTPTHTTLTHHTSRSARTSVTSEPRVLCIWRVSSHMHTHAHLRHKFPEGKSPTRNWISIFITDLVSLPTLFVIVTFTVYKALETSTVTFRPLIITHTHPDMILLFLGVFPFSFLFC